MKEMLLLGIRAETLRGNLERIANYLKNLPGRREHLNSLERQLADVRVCVAEVKKSIVGWQIDLERDEPPTEASLARALDDISKLSVHIASAKRVVEEMKELSFHLPEDPIVGEISKGMEKLAFGPFLQLDKIQDAIEKGAAPQTLHWSEFHDKALTPSKDIFDQYIDLLGGIALRDACFDAGICQVADELIRTYHPYQQSKDLLRAIPARGQSVIVTLARVIRVSFPEWTIWALPFTAHEFWHVVARHDLKDRLEREIAHMSEDVARHTTSRSQQCLADAFATYMMGPAYAYAAIMLLLDPRDPFSDRDKDAAHHLRVDAILMMLQRMDGNKSEIDEGSYTTVRTQLQAAWTAAVDQAGATCKAEQEQQLAQDKEYLEILVCALWKVLEDACAPLTNEAWRQVIAWQDALSKNGAEDLNLPLGAELRQVLNAAWLARVDENRSSDIDLNAAALKLASKAIRLREAPTSSTRGPKGRPI